MLSFAFATVERLRDARIVTAVVSVEAIDAESKIGEILSNTNKEESYKGLTSTGGRKPILPQGISHKQSHYFQQMETPTPTATPTVTPTPTTNPNDVKAIQAYMREIFRSDYKIACAVAYAESGYRTDADNVSHIENSRGIFQINIRSKTAFVHYNRIPGSTIDEKITWLENPYNNVLLAYWIFDNSGWYPWSAYTNGSYKAHLEKCF